MESRTDGTRSIEVRRPRGNPEFSGKIILARWQIGGEEHGSEANSKTEKPIKEEDTGLNNVRYKWVKKKKK